MKRTRKTDPASLASPQALGGEVADEGFHYQDAYALARIPEWLRADGFAAILKEGLGDIEVRFGSEGVVSQYHYHQVKDHAISPGELRNVLAEFHRKDKALPGCYSEFVLACPGLSPEVASLVRLIGGARNVAGFYKGPGDGVNRTTRADISAKISRLKLDTYADLLLGKVTVDCRMPIGAFEKHARAVFGTELSRMGEYAGATQGSLDQCFNELHAVLRSSRKIPLSRERIRAMIDGSVKAEASSTVEPVCGLFLHGWEAAPYDCEPQYTIDWTPHFDLKTKAVPSVETWQDHLLPQLAELRERMQEATETRLIRFRGSLCVSGGLALGNAFRQVDGYVFEVLQVGRKWRSDEMPAPDYAPLVSLEDGNDPTSDEFVATISITGDATEQVNRYLSEQDLRYRGKAAVSPPGGPRPSSIASGREAVAFAGCVKTALKEAQDKWNGYGTTHFFYFGPLGLAVFVGSLLTRCGPIQCYEHQAPGYVPSCRLDT